MGVFYDSLEPGIPADALPIVAQCLREVEKVPGIADLKMEGQWHAVTIVMMWAFPMAHVLGDASFQGLVARIAAQLRRRGEPAPADLAELQTATFLMRKAAGVDVQRLRAGTYRTADLRLVWPSGHEVDVEVTRPEPKEEMLRRRADGQRLSQELNALGLEHDLVVHIAGDVAPYHDEILRRAPLLRPGEEDGVDGEWYAVAAAVPDDVDPYELVSGTSEPLPTWWPSRRGGTGFSSSGKLNGPGATRRQPRSRVAWPIPLDRYLNPINEKAREPQGSADRPFMLAVDVGELPGAAKVYATALPEHVFPKSPDLSGVMTIQFVNAINDLQWMWSLYPNPHAARPLGPEALDAFPPDQSWKTVVKLAGDPAVGA